MKAARVGILILVLLGPLATANADVGISARLPVAVCTISSPSETLRLRASVGLQEASEFSSLAVGQSADPLEGSICRLEGCATGVESAVRPEAPAKAGVREMPALPSSGALFMAAMLSAGACQALRKARNAQWAALPAWYHADAPRQIGHSIAFDPTPGFQLLAACVFDAPAVADPARCPDISREWIAHCAFQHFLVIETPRGPPLA